MNFFEDIAVGLLELYSKSFKDHPVIIERLSLLIANTTTIILSIAILLAFFALRFKYPHFKAIKHFIQLNFVLYMIVRFGSVIFLDSFLNTYYSPFSLMCLSFDICLVLFCVRNFGEFLLRTLLEKERKTKGITNFDMRLTNIVVGLSVFILSSSMLTNFFSVIFKYDAIKLLVFAMLCYFFWNYLENNENLKIFETDPKLEKNLKNRAASLLPWIYVSLPFLPYLFAAAPPDADIISISDQMGFVLQGQNLPLVEPAFVEEKWFIRYPNGFASLNILLGVILNTGASESLYLSWILSWLLLFYGVSKWGETLGIKPWILAIFFVNPVTTGYHGLHGGQSQEILAYGLGVLSVLTLPSNFDPRKIISGIFGILASFVVHPMVGLIFLPCIFWFLFRSFFPRPFSWIPTKRRVWITISVAIIYATFYLALLSFGRGDTPSQPEILLNSLSIEIFWNNLQKYIVSDSLGLWWIFPLAFFCIYLYGKKLGDHAIYILLLLWFLGGILADGFFGHTLWGARFHGSFSIVGVWIISISFVVDRLLKFTSELLSKSNFRVYRNHQKLILIFLIFLCLSTWFYFLQGPGFMLRTETVFISFSDTILARRFRKSQESNTNFNHLVTINTRVPNDFESDFGMGSMLRAELKLPVIYGRLGSHQLKYAREDSSKRTMISNCRANKNVLLEELLACFQKVPGVEYVFFPSRLKTRDLTNNSNLKPVDRQMFASIYKL